MRKQLKEQQPIFYQILKNAITDNKISHAYLLVSQKGVNTSAIATFLAQSIMCQEDDIACEECPTCSKIKEKNHIDVITFDGVNESIKKKDIENIQQRFASSSVEGTGKIYILQHIDNATVESMNSLLKMLEEPTPGIYAIFTCDNIERVLPTIISRCQVIHFKGISIDGLVAELIAEGITRENALLLTQIYESKETILEVEKSEAYFNLKIEAIHFLEDYFLKKDNLMINTQTHLLKKFKDKKDISLFLDLAILAFKDVLHKQYGIKLLYENQEELISKCKDSNNDIIHVIELLLETKEKIQGNSNIALAMDYLMYHM